MKRKFLIFPFLQGFYFLLTVVWPLIDIESFMKVTGPKVDTWLVVTVSWLLLPYTLIALTAAFNWVKINKLLIFVMILVSLALAGVEFYYYLMGRIRWVYAAGGVLQLIFAGWWSREWMKQNSVKYIKS